MTAIRSAALRSSDVADVVFYVGTFSKCMLPSLRLGFIVASDWAMPTLVAAKNCLDWHCSTPVQLGVAGFVSDGSLRRHVGRLRGIYKERRQLLLDSLHREFTDWLTPIPSSYGMHVTAVARGRVDLEQRHRRTGQGTGEYPLPAPLLRWPADAERTGFRVRGGGPAADQEGTCHAAQGACRGAGLTSARQWRKCCLALTPKEQPR